MNKAPLLLLLLIFVPIVGAINFNYPYTFQPSGSGNITFAHNFTATSLTLQGDQVRFTDFIMLSNETIEKIGFNCNETTSIMNITGADETYLQFTTTIPSNYTEYDVWLPLGEPDTVIGADSYSWSGDTLTALTGLNTTIIFTWSNLSTIHYGGYFKILPIITLIFISIILLNRRK